MLFFRGCRSPLSATRALTLWIVSNEPGLLRAKDASRSEIAVLSGPIWDRANRVTQACHLKRVASNGDRRIGRIGDWTDHLCPCPSRLRWALPWGREGLVRQRWQDRSVASDDRDPAPGCSPRVNDYRKLDVSMRHLESLTRRWAASGDGPRRPRLTGRPLDRHQEPSAGNRERLAGGAGGGNERPCSPARGRRNPPPGWRPLPSETPSSELSPLAMPPQAA